LFQLNQNIPPTVKQVYMFFNKTKTSSPVKQVKQMFKKHPVHCPGEVTVPSSE